MRKKFHQRKRIGFYFFLMLFLFVFPLTVMADAPSYFVPKYEPPNYNPVIVPPDWEKVRWGQSGEQLDGTDPTGANGQLPDNPDGEFSLWEFLLGLVQNKEGETLAGVGFFTALLLGVAGAGFAVSTGAVPGASRLFALFPSTGQLTAGAALSRFAAGFVNKRGGLKVALAGLLMMSLAGAAAQPRFLFDENLSQTRWQEMMDHQFGGEEVLQIYTLYKQIRDSGDQEGMYRFRTAIPSWMIAWMDKLQELESKGIPFDQYMAYAGDGESGVFSYDTMKETFGLEEAARFYQEYSGNPLGDTLFLLLAESRKAKANGLGSNLTMDSIRADVSFEEFQQFLNRYGLENHVGELTKPGVISREEFEQIYALQDFVVMDGKNADYRSRDGRSSVGSVVLAELASMTADSIPIINVGTSGYAAGYGYDYFTEDELAGWERVIAVGGYLRVIKKAANFGETVAEAYKLSERIHQTSEIARQSKMKQVLDAVSGKNGQTAKGTGNGIPDCDCFTAGTRVTTVEGEKPIEEIAVGDQVLAKDDVTGEMAYKEVEWLYQRNVEETYNITVGGEVITTTDEHPFWIVGKGWVESKKLAVGDVLTTSDGKEIAIEKIEVKKEHNKVYNFKVKDFHTYFVSNLGIWTHNRCDVTPEGTGDVKPVKEVEIVDKNGRPIGELDEIDLKNGVFYEDKTAKGLNIVNPKTGLPAQTPQQFADKQILDKTRKRIVNLKEAIATRSTKNGTPDVPSLDQIQNIRKFVFRLDGDTPELRQAVENSLNQLRKEFPDHTFEAIFGGEN
ncbi:polymorphic toxin-type HINT domain-containing protein [Brevibacillus migulae]|uniref:polymorphic toxin-type HINT domain-containing protein n=1 Tax=Brevibacillus migulae TaxID=1644114 RepID=UPI001F2F6028|nr:polymorphic toxin-type HINT domain-containing protein [Brevibacillus migulae]